MTLTCQRITCHGDDKPAGSSLGNKATLLAMNKVANDAWR
jgi:hypothetical protein